MIVLRQDAHQVEVLCRTLGAESGSGTRAQASIFCAKAVWTHLSCKASLQQCITDVLQAANSMRLTFVANIGIEWSLVEGAKIL